MQEPAQGESVPEPPTPYTYDALIRARQEIDQWIRDGQSILGRVIPALFQAIDGLRMRAERAEDEVLRLRAELAHVSAEMARLQAEFEGLRGLRVAAEEVRSKLDELLFVVEHLREQLRRGA